MFTECNTYESKFEALYNESGQFLFSLLVIKL